MENILLILSGITVLYGLIIIVLIMRRINLNYQLHLVLLVVLCFLCCVNISLLFVDSFKKSEPDDANLRESDYRMLRSFDIEMEECESSKSEGLDTVIITGKDISVKVKSHAGFDIIY